MVLLFWFCLILLFSCVVVVVIVIVIWSLDLTFPVIPRLMQSPHKLLLVMTLLPYRVQNRLRVAKCHGTGAYRHFLLSVMFLMVFNFQGMVTNQSCSIHRRPPCNREAQENSEPGNGDCYKANMESQRCREDDGDDMCVGINCQDDDNHDDANMNLPGGRRELGFLRPLTHMLWLLAESLAHLFIVGGIHILRQPPEGEEVRQILKC